MPNVLISVFTTEKSMISARQTFLDSAIDKGESVQSLALYHACVNSMYYWNKQSTLQWGKSRKASYLE